MSYVYVVENDVQLCAFTRKCEAVRFVKGLSASYQEDTYVARFAPTKPTMPEWMSVPEFLESA